MKTITPCLWFDSQAEDAAEFYVAIFPNSRITAISRYGEAGKEHHGQPAGSVMVVAFELNGQPCTALNGGPLFQFNEAISLQVPCDNQEEIDRYWAALTEGGPEDCQQCGWLKDRFGVSWQITPKCLPELLGDGMSPAAQRVMAALMEMKKLDIATLQRAHAG